MLSECTPANLQQSQCHKDSSSDRVLPHTEWLSNPATTQSTCATACGTQNFTIAGVEFGVACFCGHAMPSSPRLPTSSCGAMACAGNRSEACGDANVMLAYPIQCVQSPSAILAELMPPHDYQGENRMFRTAVRTTLSRALDITFELEVVVLSSEVPSSVHLHIGDSASYEMTIEKDAISKEQHSQVYKVSVEFDGDFEYFVDAEFATAAALRVPATGNQSVVVV